MGKFWMLVTIGIVLAGLTFSTNIASAAPAGPSAAVLRTGQMVSNARMTIGRPRVLEKKRRMKHGERLGR